MLSFKNINHEVAKKGENSLRVMTYNVHGFKNQKKRKNYEAIINCIIDIDPDILFLQEVFIYRRNETFTDEKLIDSLKKIGLEHYRFSKTGINAVFSKLKFNEETTIELNLGIDPIYKLPRNSLICQFIDVVTLSGVDKNINKNLTIIGTHLDAFDESGKTRIKQINKIINHRL